VGGAVDSLCRRGAREEDLTIFKVPGAFEIPLVAKRVAESKILMRLLSGSSISSQQRYCLGSFGNRSAGALVITTDTLEQAMNGPAASRQQKIAAAEAAKKWFISCAG
jgi:6,7-dimethyl-8-ribityllumazine synthase